EVRGRLPRLPGRPVRLRPGREAMIRPDPIRSDPTRSPETKSMSITRWLNRRRPWLLVAVLLGVALARPETARAAPSQPPIDVASLRVGFVAGGQGNVFKPGKWTPLW